MNRYIHAIASRLSLRAPQRRALEILDRVTEIAPPKKRADLSAVLAERLMRSVKRQPLTQVEEAWVKEAERRFSAWRRGKRAGVPVEMAPAQHTYQEA